MTDNAQSPNMAKIRELLNSTFDATGLDAFCHDHFPGVFGQFGRGMRTNEKITLLLDHCRRRPDDLGRLTDLLAQARPPKPRKEPPSDDSPKKPLERVRNLPVWYKIGAIIGILACIVVVVVMAPAIAPIIQDLIWPPDFVGKVCEIKNGWDTNTIFLRQTEFDALELPIGARGTVSVRDTGKSVEGVTLSLDSGLEIGSVRLSEPLREALDVDSDTMIQPVSKRPNRRFDITPTSSPTNREFINIQGKVCRIKEAEQDTATIFLRQAEFDAFGVPAGTTVSVTVHDTSKIVEKVTLGLDSGLTTCSVRLSPSLREVLGVAEDTDIEPPEDRPVRQFSIRLSQP